MLSKLTRLLVFSAVFLALVTGATGCQTPPEGVTNKVLADFGLRDRPEGYVSGSDQVFERLDEVGQTEIRRLNLENRNGTIEFIEEGLRGHFYKQVKVYEEFTPVDARAITTRGPSDSRSYQGYIEYRYRMYQSPYTSNRTEAQAASATIPTETEGREVYRYKFGLGGVWDGAKGELSRN